MNIKLLRLHQAYDKHSPVLLGKLGATGYHVGYCSCGVFFCGDEGSRLDRLVCGIINYDHEWRDLLAASPDIKPLFNAYTRFVGNTKSNYNWLEEKIARASAREVICRG